ATDNMVKQLLILILTLSVIPDVKSAGAGKTCKSVLEKVKGIKASIENTLDDELKLFHKGLANLTKAGGEDGMQCLNSSLEEQVATMLEHALENIQLGETDLDKNCPSTGSTMDDIIKSLIREEVSKIRIPTGTNTTCGSSVYVQNQLRNILEKISKIPTTPATGGGNTGGITDDNVDDIKNLLREEMIIIEKGLNEIKGDFIPWNHHPRTHLLANVALKKPASQSSSQNWGTRPGIASLAVDGDDFPEYHRGNCSRTKAEYTPHWQVDLKQQFLIKAVEIVYRTDEFNDLMKDFTISVSKDGSRWESCLEFKGSQSYFVQTYHCKEFHSGRFVRIGFNLLTDSRGTPKKRELLMCEVFVRATTLNELEQLEKVLNCEWKEEPLVPWTVHPPAVILANVARGNPAVQSSSQNWGTRPGIANLAVDGDEFASYTRGNCSRTKVELEPWWEVDLKQRFLVKAVEIVFRDDGGVLNDFTIGVSEDASIWKTCLKFDGTQSYIRQTYHCEYFQTGRYVRIKMHPLKKASGAQIMREMILCEVLMRA
ncbi:unnamed protein product, partial [Owenia fusiformis]